MTERRRLPIRIIRLSGVKVFEKKLGISKSTIRCEHCGKEKYWEYTRYKRWISLYYIPIIPISTKKIFHCPECKYGIEVTEFTEDRVLPLIYMLDKGGK